MFASTINDTLRKIDAKWFCGRMNIRIVRIYEPRDSTPKYYIGAFTPSTPEQDAQYIADWGSTFPKKAGDVLFANE